MQRLGRPFGGRGPKRFFLSESCFGIRLVSKLEYPQEHPKRKHMRIALKLVGQYSLWVLISGETQRTPTFCAHFVPISRAHPAFAVPQVLRAEQLEVLSNLGRCRYQDRAPDASRDVAGGHDSPPKK